MRYRAFISYASVDRAIGEQFQRAIERYKIPRVLRGANHGFGAVPTRVAPLFRDRSDANASVSLAVTLRSALEDSDALVVLCSPAAATSPWVGQEIRTFKALGRAERIFPVIVDGVPARFDAARCPQGAFPPALYARVDASGAVIADDGPEPLASDVRVTGDGLHVAMLKVVAALTGVPLTILTQRQLEAERRERLIVRTVAAVMTTLAVTASVAAVQAWRSAAEARARLADTIEIAARGVDNAVRFGDEYGVPIAVIRKLLSGADADFTELVGSQTISAPMLELQRGRLFVLYAGLHRAVGDTKRELELARLGLATIERVSTVRSLRHPITWFAPIPRTDNVTAERLGALEALSVALNDLPGRIDEGSTVLERGRAMAARAGRVDYVARFWSLTGEQRYTRGDASGALAAHDSAIKALASEPSKYALDLALARADHAELLLESERHQEALDEQTLAVRELETQVRAAPNDVVILRSLGHTITRLAEARYAISGDWSASIPDFERALALFERIVASDKLRIDYARDLSIALERLGDVMLQLGNTARANTLLQRSIDLRRERFARDPGNGDAARDLAVGLERQGDLAIAQHRPDRAVAILDEARALRTTSDTAAANQEPSRTRDLAVLWWKTGQARATLGQGEAWQTAFETAIGLMTPLAARADAPPGWDRDLAVLKSSFAESLARVGRAADARAQWMQALALTDRQLVVNPGDPRLKEDRALLQSRLAGRRKR